MNQNTLLLAHFCESEGPSSLFCTQSITSFTNDEKDLSRINNTVQSMSSVILQDIEYITIDDRSVYLSSHHIKPSYTAQFKSLSLRTLSVEYVGPGREGPVLFGDERNGYNFAYVFKIKDHKARGFTRWFAFILMDASLSSLTLSWAFIQKYVRHSTRSYSQFDRALSKIVKTIKIRSQEIFVLENSEQHSNGADVADILHYRTTTAPLTADLFRQKRSQGPLRVLPLLLQYPTLFRELHEWTSGILKAFSERMIRLPRSSTTSDPQPAIEHKNSVHCLSALFQFSTLIRKCLLRKYHLSGTGSPYASGSVSPNTLGVKRQSIDALHRRMMQTMIHNVIVGNQVIVRGDNPEFINSIVTLFMV